jgi:starch phosphorylase
MKFMMNGALTIGTLDGANIEIRQEVGVENFFLFGLTAQQVAERKASGYSPHDYYHSDGALREVIDAISRGDFSRGDRGLFQPLVDSLMQRDEYMLFADFAPYVDCQARVSETYTDPERWSRMSILNTARSGKFSSDRSVQEYCQRVWRCGAVPVLATSA